MPKLFFCLCLVPSMIFAQTLHRDPPPLDPAQAQVLGAQANAILNGPLSPQTAPVPELPKVPKGYHAKKDIHLDQTATKALAIADDYRTTSAPVAGTEGRVIYPYGAGSVDLVCAPLHMCTIELEPGEVLSGKAQIADQIRWDLKQFLIGSKDGPQTFIAVHPKVSGIDTNMIIPTDRRMYFLHLVSKPGQYIPRIAFSYQDDSDADWDQYKTKLASMTLAPIVAPRIVTPPEKPKAVAFCDKPNITRGYKFKSKHYVDFVPIDACDDGLYTSITLPPIVNKSTGPILVLGSARHAERPNLDMHGSTIIVHRLFTHAQLVEGTGRHALKVDIVSPRTHE